MTISQKKPMANEKKHRIYLNVVLETQGRRRSGSPERGRRFGSGWRWRGTQEGSVRTQQEDAELLELGNQNDVSGLELNSIKSRSQLLLVDIKSDPVGRCLAERETARPGPVPGVLES